MKRDTTGGGSAPLVTTPPTRRVGVRLYAAILTAFGAALVLGGVQLIALGGSPYYGIAGAAIVVSAILLWRGQRGGARLYGLVVLGTIAWSIWEAGADGWAIVPRVIPMLAVGVPLPFLSRRLAGPVASDAARPIEWWVRLTPLAAVFVAVIIGASAHALFAERDVDPVFQRGIGSAGSSITSPANAPGSDWVGYGGDNGSARFSALTQIEPANVDRLRVAWRFRVGHTPKGLGSDTALSGTPLKVGDTLYACTGYNDVVALDADTGIARWRFRSGVDLKQVHIATCRGVAFARVASSDCPERILTNTLDTRLIALDARTGRPCRGFGQDGQVALKDGMGPVLPGYYYQTSAPIVVAGNVVVGGWVFDNQYRGEPSGVIRGFDVVSGKLAWAWDMGRPDRKTAPPPGERYTPSTPNSWAPMAADDALGMVYVPTGGAPPDFFGGYRRSFDEKYGSSIVALDARTGDVRWSFQTTHHDIWDYDVASSPSLLELSVGGRTIPALAQPTKRGQVFLLDRRTGRPLSAVVERAVPFNGAVPEERPSPTQPYSTGLPAFSGPPLHERDMWGVTPLDHLWCRIKFRQSRYEGEFTLPGLKRSLLYPGYMGGMNWGGVSIDRARSIMVVSSLRLATLARIIPAEERMRRNIAPILGANVMRPGGLHEGFGAQANTPYAVELEPFLSPLGVPCQEPPYGVISAVDLNSRKLLWTKPLGTAREAGPMGYASRLPITIGVPLQGGSITTASGLTFIGASQDGFIRAFDTRTGKLLWKDLLPAGGNATPITYTTGSGRQLLVIAAGGSRTLRSRMGDYIVAYTLKNDPADGS